MASVASMASLTLHRRCATVVFLLPLLVQLVTRAAAASDPNVVFVFVDDAGLNDWGPTSADMSELTPTIAALAEEGVWLGDYYGMQVCTPARGALLTGKYPVHNGLSHHLITLTYPYALGLEHKLLPEYVKEVGYAPHMIGKWHLGHYSEPFLPTRRGWNSFFGYYSGYVQAYNDSTYDTFTAESLDFAPYTDERYFDIRDGDQLLPHEVLQEEGLTATDLFARQAVHKLEELAQAPNDDEPFFLYLPLPNTHFPMVDVPDSAYSAQFEDILSGIGNTVRRRFARSVVALDGAVRSVVAALDANGLRDDTVIIIAADNGALCNEQGGGSNWPLRGGKEYYYEGGMRINALVHAPQYMDPSRFGTTLPGLFHVTDWLPTLVSGLMGRPDVLPDNLDGVNQWDFLIGKTEEPPRTELLYNIDPIDEKGAIRVGDMKLLVNESANVGWYAVPPDDDTAWAEFPPSEDLRIPLMLFNVRDDPTESHDLASEPEYADVVQQLLVRYMEFRATMEPSAYCPIMDDDNAYPAWEADHSFIGPWVAPEDVPNYCDSLSR